MPAVLTTHEVATIPNTSEETSVLPFEKSPSRSHKERPLLLAHGSAPISSATSSPVSLPEDHLAETSNSDATSSSLLAQEAVRKDDMLDLLNQGAAVWNQWRKDHDQNFPDLRWIDLHEKDLRGFNFCGVNLQGADLRNANLFGVDLIGATLQMANLEGASLVSADLTKADLRGANLCRADLTCICLKEAILTDARLEETINLNTRCYYWSIEGIICETLYWDRNTKPRRYKAGAFEQRYRTITVKRRRIRR